MANESEIKAAQRSKQKKQLLSQLGTPQTQSVIEQALNLEGIGERLRAGDKIGVNELPLDLQRKLSLDPTQQISLPKDLAQGFGGLQEAGDMSRLQAQVAASTPAVPVQPSAIDKVANNRALNPFKNIQDIINALRPAQASAEEVVPTGPTIVPQSTPTGSSGLEDFMNQLRNQLAGFFNKSPISQAIQDVAAPLPSNMTGDELNVLQRVLNPEGRQRTGQDINQLLQRLIPALKPGLTLEQELLKQINDRTKLPTNDPNYIDPNMINANTTISKGGVIEPGKGLKKLAGIKGKAGEMKVGAKTYRINKSGQIELVRG